VQLVAADASDNLGCARASAPAQHSLGAYARRAHTRTKRVEAVVVATSAQDGRLVHGSSREEGVHAFDDKQKSN
jgi:hypothetical protein